MSAPLLKEKNSIKISELLNSKDYIKISIQESFKAEKKRCQKRKRCQEPFICMLRIQDSVRHSNLPGYLPLHGQYPCLDFLYVQKLQKMLKQVSIPGRKCAPALS